jgi:predicted transcriptional regulator
MNDWHWIERSDAADALLNPVTFRYFAVFVGQPVTLSEAARRLELKRTTLRYHVQRFLEWGLLKVTASVQRGRERKVYEAVSDRLYIPFSVSSLDTLEACVQEAQDPLQREFVADLVRATAHALPEAHRGGTVIHTRSGGSISVDFTPTPPPQVQVLPVMACGVWTSWTTLHLTLEEARDLEARLRGLWEEALSRSATPRARTKAYTLRLGLTPRAV